MDPHKLYMVGKRRFSALKWILACQNQLRIKATGADLPFIGLFFQNALVDYIGVCTDTNYVVNSISR